MSDLMTKPDKKRRFAAFVISEVTWKVVLILMLWLFDVPNSSVIITAIVVIGFIESIYLAGEASLDMSLKEGRIRIMADDDEEDIELSLSATECDTNEVEVSVSVPDVPEPPKDLK